VEPKEGEGKVKCFAGRRGCEVAGGVTGFRIRTPREKEKEADLDRGGTQKKGGDPDGEGNIRGHRGQTSLTEVEEKKMNQLMDGGRRGRRKRKPGATFSCEHSRRDLGEKTWSCKEFGCKEDITMSEGKFEERRM